MSDSAATPSTTSRSCHPVPPPAGPLAPNSSGSRHRARPRVGAAARSVSRSLFQAVNATASRTRTAATSAARLPRRAGDRYQFEARRRREAVSGSGVAIPAGGSARAVGDRRSRRVLAGPTAAWRGASREGQVVYELHVGTFTTRRHVGRGRTRAARTRAPRHHAHRGDAGRRVRGTLRLGLRRRRSLRAVAPLRAPGRFPPIRRCRARRRHRRHPRRRLQPPRAVGQLPARVLRRPISPIATGTNGARRSTSTGSTPARCASSSSSNAGYWIDEFHLDGLRLDATQSIYDRSEEHVLAAIGRARAIGRGGAVDRHRRGERAAADVARAAGRRRRLRARRAVERRLPSQRDGRAHRPRGSVLQRHARRAAGVHLGRQVRLPLSGAAVPLAARTSRVTPAWGVPPSAFVAFTQNHDQVANSARGQRGHELTSPGRWRAMTALLLLQPAHADAVSGPGILGVGAVPVLRGLRTRPRAAIRKGRGEFLAQFPSIVETRRRGALADPGAPETFERCKLDFGERESHRDAYALHRDLLRLGAKTRCSPRPRLGGVDGAVLSPSAFVLRFFTPDHRDDRLLVVNLGAAI